MDILTLLKANLRRKKGTFLSVTVLTALIVMAIAVVFSVRDNYESAFDSAQEFADTGELTAFIQTQKCTDELRNSVENSSLVEKVTYEKAMNASKATTGDNENGSDFLLSEMTDKIKLYNADANAFVSDVPALSAGEIYFPLGLKNKMDCNVGDTVRMKLSGGVSAAFVIKGFVQEPTLGAMMIGLKFVFISHADYEKYDAQCKPLETADEPLDFTVMRIWQAKDSGLSLAKFQRQLNLETKFTDYALFTINQAETRSYTTLLPDMLLDVLLAFAILLFVTVLIVMSHSIATEIEMDYTALGILKSQGFLKGRIRVVLVLQYLIAETVGAVLGCVAAIPLERMISGIFRYVTAILPNHGMSVGKTLLFTAGMLLVSAVPVLLKTRRIARISPVRAISGGREEIYFSSRMNLPVGKRFLNLSLSFRQFTSAKRRYLGVIFITAILTFCMITVNLVGNLFSSRTALGMMGFVIPDMRVTFPDKDTAADFDGITQIIRKHTGIRQENSTITQYNCLNGESLYCEMFENPAYIPSILKGRAPLYDNEILITEMVADELDIRMGDEVTVTSGDQGGQYVVSGIYQAGNDAGRTFSMSFAAARKLGVDTNVNSRYYLLEDPSQTNAIAEDITAKYGDQVNLWLYDEDNIPEMQLYNTIVLALKIVIYALSILFSFVVVRMVCAKAFQQERMDIGIYKAVGFSSGRLRLGFALRFLIVAGIGSVIGAACSMALSESLVSFLFRVIGIVHVVLNYTAFAIVMPIAVISLSVFVFAYLVSRKIKRVAVRELVVE